MKTTLLVGACALALALVARAETGIVKVDRLNVRAQAKANAETITQLNKGDQVAVLDKKAVPYGNRTMVWLKVALPDKATVWIKTEFVKDGLVTAEKVNIRSGGGVNFSIVGQARKGDKVQMVRSLGDWSEIRPLPGCFGWVSNDYIELTPELLPAPPAETIQPVVPPVGQSTLPAEATSPATGVTVVPPTPAPTTAPAKAATASSVVVTSGVEERKTDAAPESSLMPEGSPKPATRQGLLLSCADMLIKRPGTHALWQEGVTKPHIIAYLKSSTVDLTKYQGKRVQITGSETTLLNWQNPLIDVEQVTPTW